MTLNNVKKSPNISNETYLINPMEKLNVLFVDDEENLLHGLRRSLRRKALGWETRFANSGEEALNLMGESPADVIVTDMRMPGMNGVELLKEVKAKYPKTVRFILSGFSDKALILDSVGLCHQFFAKPCDIEQLLEAVNFSNSLYAQLGEERLQKLICEIKNLPTPPETYMAINKELKKEEPSIETVAEIIRKDASISAKVLQLVNSAFFGIGTEVTDIAQASSLLGTEHLKSIILMIGIADEFSKSENPASLDAYRRHSLEVATECEHIAKELGYKFNEVQTCFTAGLLHDIGKLVMLSHFKTKYSGIEAFRLQTPGTEAVQDLESEVFGTNHAIVGAALLALWGLPPQVVNAVAHHHKPGKISLQEITLATIIHVANAVVWHRHHSKDGNLNESDLIDPDHISKCGLTDSVLGWSNTPNS